MRSPLRALLALLLPLLAASSAEPDSLLAAGVPVPDSLLVAGDPDPGIVLEVDLGATTLRAHDLASATAGPRLRVAIGSPSYPTPTGVFTPTRLVRHPAWTPGPVARARGGRATPASPGGPLGLGKLPLAGAIQLHAGAHPLELGKPVSLGCIATDDAGWDELVRWLASRDTLHPWRPSRDGESEAGFRRPLRVVVR